jgi:hypothetical protein
VLVSLKSLPARDKYGRILSNVVINKATAGFTNEIPRLISAVKPPDQNSFSKCRRDLEVLEVSRELTAENFL